MDDQLIRTAALRIAAIFLFTSALLCHAAENAEGRWSGSVQIPGRELTVVVDLAQNKGSDWTGSIIIPGMDVKGTPLTDIAVKEAEVAFAIKGALGGDKVGPAKFAGQLKENGELSGNFLQAGNSAPFVLHKTGPAEVELPQQSTPVSKNLEGTWKGSYEMQGYPRHVTLKLANRAVDGASADFVIVGKRTNNVPVDLITQGGDFLSIESREFGITYEGHVGKGGEEIKGHFIQGPFELPLNLHRSK